MSNEWIVSDSLIVRPNAIFAIVAYDEGDHVHAKTAWNPRYDHLPREDRERMFIAVRDALNEATALHLLKRPRKRSGQ